MRAGLRPALPRTILLRAPSELVTPFAPRGLVIYLYLAAGGVIGTLARYGVGQWFPTRAGTDFPWPTFAINVTGSLVLGFAARAFETMPVTPEVRALVAVGFCGAFTTFSTYSYETVALMQAGHWGRASLYAAGSVAVGLLAVFAGMTLAGAAFRPRG